MYHSITFGSSSNEIGYDNSLQKWVLRGINSWDHWFLIPTKRPDIALPGVTTNYADIPGRDGSLDLSDAMTGRPVYTDRTGTIEFLVMNDKRNDSSTFNGTWADLRNNIVQYLHGKTRFMTAESEPDYYYSGRFAVDSWSSESDYSHITISYRLRPFKKHIINIFYEGLTDLSNLAVYGNSINRAIGPAAYSAGIPLVATLTGGSAVTVSYGGRTATLTPSRPEATLGTPPSSSATGTLSAGGDGVVSLAFGGGIL